MVFTSWKSSLAFNFFVYMLLSGGNVIWSCCQNCFALHSLGMVSWVWYYWGGGGVGALAKTFSRNWFSSLFFYLIGIFNAFTPDDNDIQPNCSLDDAPVANIGCTFYFAKVAIGRRKLNLQNHPGKYMRSQRNCMRAPCLEH